MRWIQLKWSDETEWKNFQRADCDFPQELIDELVPITDAELLAYWRRDWLATKAKYKLKHDVELRIV